MPAPHCKIIASVKSHAEALKIVRDSDFSAFIVFVGFLDDHETKAHFFRVVEEVYN